MKYKIEIFIVLAVVFVVSVLYTDTTSVKRVGKDEAAFNKWFLEIIDSAKANPEFEKIPLEKKSDSRWFVNLLHQVWEKKITKDEFIRQGVEKYPDYKKSFNYLASRFTVQKRDMEIIKNK